MFDVNAEKICCSHCKKVLGRDDKFILTHYLLYRFPNPAKNEPKCFCCKECAILDEPLLETFLIDMAIKCRNLYMYSPDRFSFLDDIGNEQPRLITLAQAFNSFVSKYNANRIYIELNTSLNKLKRRQEEQMND